VNSIHTEIYTLSLHDALPIYQICGEYQPCDLEENARRSKHRAAPLS